MNRFARVAACVTLAAALLPAGAFAQPRAAAPAAPQAPVEAESFTSEELLARAKTASGIDHRPEDEHEYWSLKAYGLEGSVETWRDGTDQRSDTTLGPFKTARGTVHGSRWHQNDNGETILDKPEPSQIEKTTSEIVTRVRTPDAWLLTTYYASGHIVKNYYDSKTFLLVKTVRTVAGRDSFMTYDDFRTDAKGRTRAWHYIGGDDRPANDYEYHLLRDDSITIANEQIAIPKDRRTLVEFPSGADYVRLPARIVNDRIYVRLDIAGRGVDFLLDSGASTINIDTAVARDLGLGIVGHSSATVAGTYATGRVVVPAVGIGSLTMHDVVMHTVPIDQREKTVRVVGLLGFDFLDAAGLRIDYANGTVDAYKPGTLTPPTGALPVDVTLNTGVPVVHATFGDAGGDDFVIDTGAAFPYVLFQRFVRSHPAAAVAQPSDQQSRFLSGVGGQIEYRSVNAKRFTFGAYALDDQPGIEALSANAFGFDNQDGLIGADILKLFTIYTDYGAGKLYFAATPQSAAAGVRTARVSR